MSGNYLHTNPEYFRLGRCESCGMDSYHKPVERKRKSGRNESFWECEYCHFETNILTPVADEFALVGEWVRATYLKKI